MPINHGHGIHRSAPLLRRPAPGPGHGRRRRPARAALRRARRHQSRQRQTPGDRGNADGGAAPASLYCPPRQCRAFGAVRSRWRLGAGDRHSRQRRERAMTFIKRVLPFLLLLAILMPAAAFAAPLHMTPANAAAATATTPAANGGLSIDLNGSGLFTDRMLQIVALVPRL